MLLIIIIIFIITIVLLLIIPIKFHWSKERNKKSIWNISCPFIHIGSDGFKILWFASRKKVKNKVIKKKVRKTAKKAKKGWLDRVVDKFVKDPRYSRLKKENAKLKHGKELQEAYERGRLEGAGLPTGKELLEISKGKGKQKAKEGAKKETKKTTGGSSWKRTLGLLAGGTALGAGGLGAAYYMSQPKPKSNAKSPSDTYASANTRRYA